MRTRTVSHPLLVAALAGAAMTATALPAAPATAATAATAATSAAATAATSAAASSLPAFSLRTKEVTRNVPAATVVGVRVGRHVGYDRLVVDLRGRPSGYRIGYVRQLAGPSGKPISLRGAADLSVALIPAQAHTSSGRSTLRPQRRILNLPSLKEFRLVEDFEGVVVIGVGVAHKRAFRVFTLTRPSRIVVDVRH